MSRLIGTFVMLFALLMAGQAPAVAAPTDPIAILKDLPGLKAAYARKYISADQVAPPGVATSVPVYQHLVVTPTVLEFSSSFSLALARRAALNQTAIRQMLGEPTGTITTSDASQVGPGATIYLVRTDIGDGQAHALLIATHGTFGFLIRADGPEAELKPVLLAFGRSMTSARPSDDRVVFRKVRSTGGLWALFPTDDSVLQGLAPMYDYDLLGPSGESPIGSATPAS